ncbi:MAG: alanine--tRNA ligase [Bacteroidota bacterium]
MTSNEIRETFLSFFSGKNHQIVSSAPMVVKNDPTLMFTNAGMNQFKDIFLGNNVATYTKVSNSQKCLRVSGKHNDLEEVGKDTYHHTMFEMLGNWSFGDYFKKDAIDWAWQLLADVYKIDKDRMYVTVFGGDKGDGLEADSEALEMWKKYVPEERILFGSKKDNFWEMGDSGPCGPCSEIHVDIRSEEDRKKISGKDLVNNDHPQVIEIWNLVFIQYNRQSNGSLVQLSAKHVDTGMGFERLCMVLQGKQSNYDTDVFQPIIQGIAQMAGVEYGKNEVKDIAIRVIADHLRAISFAIADGQLPSNTGAGYVIRRILRRAVRYGYTFLNFNEPFITKLVPVLVNQMGHQFLELKKQGDLIIKVIAEEEQSFLRTLSLGIQKFENHTNTLGNNKEIGGDFAFELFDTFGFPIDLTCLIASEKGLTVDMEGFKKGLEAQKTRSRQAAVVETEDWVDLIETQTETKFLGYDTLLCESPLVKYRKVKAKDKEFYQLVFEQTPFYAESGGQAGDKGIMICGEEKIVITDTKKENNLTVHISNSLPVNLNGVFALQVDAHQRQHIENNHSATHLLHSALRKVLGTHVEQKGSLVNSDRLRFDFSHFAKVSDEEIAEVEKIVNSKIRQNIALTEYRDMPIDEASKMGAMALFGEKYGNKVRVIQFDSTYSTELCGGTHVKATGHIGLFRIVSEGAIAAGVRRIEAITADAAEEFLNTQIGTLNLVKETLKNPKDVVKSVTDLMETVEDLKKQLEQMNREKAGNLSETLKNSIEVINGVNFIAARVDFDAATVKDLSFKMKGEIEHLMLLLITELEGKVGLSLILSDNLVTDKGMDASKLIREIAVEVQGGGGGQKFYATAGGKNPAGIDNAIKKAKSLIL